jgi:hypothetical protein
VTVSPSNTPEDDDWENFDLRQFVLNTIQSIEFHGDDHGQLEDRVIRLEEIVAARWPRSVLLRWRLAREVRASVAGYDDAYIPRDDFYGRRLQWAGDSIIASLSRRHRIWDERRRQRAEAARELGEQAGEDGSADPGAGFLS